MKKKFLVLMTAGAMALSFGAFGNPGPVEAYNYAADGPYQGPHTQDSLDYPAKLDNGAVLAANLHSTYGYYVDPSSVMGQKSDTGNVSIGATVYTYRIKTGAIESEKFEVFAFSKDGEIYRFDTNTQKLYKLWPSATSVSEVQMEGLSTAMLMYKIYAGSDFVPQGGKITW